MCGIAGELRFDGRRPDLAAVDRMATHLEPRGPDGAGVWASGPVALGHRRLAIIDLSRRGDQPMTDPELGLTVVFNGCIYNHRELRRDLEAAGYRFFSTSDTEILLKGYHRWGPERFLDRLVGMFAFCIVERDTGRALLARDRLGVKPLYLAEAGGVLRFSSSLPSLVAGGGVDTAIDPVALHHYLTFHAVVPAPRTVLRGVTKLAPGHLLVVEADGRRRVERYWGPPFEADPSAVSRDAGQWLEATSEALRRAVRRRLVADVPVGVLLSGGLDSSLIVALLAEEEQPDLATFSIGFESGGGQEGDEFRWSDMVASRFGTNHHRLQVPTDDVLAALAGAVAAMSEPMVSHDVVAFYLLSREVSRHCKVVQSGQGADEVFAGYHWYQRMAGVTGDGLADYTAAFFDRTDDEVAAAVSPEYRVEGNPSLDFVRDHFAQPGAGSALRRALRIDTHVMLVEDPVKRVDNMTMAWGLEARVPFLDHELVELAAACPAELLVAHGGKGILKDLARPLLPGEVIDRPKGYFPVPPLVHLEGDAVELLRDALLAPEAKDRGLFRPEHVEHLLAHPHELTTLKYNQLWELGMLELWLQRHGIS
jgi:asparagine synthase (glutamine-hydrolysing)